MKGLRDSKDQTNKNIYIDLMSSFFKTNSLVEGNAIDFNNKLKELKSTFTVLRDVTCENILEEFDYIKQQLNTRCIIKVSFGGRSTMDIGLLERSSKTFFEISSVPEYITHVKVTHDNHCKYLEISKYQFCDSVFKDKEAMVRFAAFSEKTMKKNISIWYGDSEKELIANIEKNIKYPITDITWPSKDSRKRNILPKAVALCVLEKLCETAWRGAGYNVPSVPLLILIPASIIAACLVNKRCNSSVSV